MLSSMPEKYWSSVQLGSTPRTGVCQVWRCVSTNPGMTMRLRASMTLAFGLDFEVAADGRDLVAVDEHVGERQVAELGIERQHVAAFDQSRAIRVRASADHRCLLGARRAASSLLLLAKATSLAVRRFMPPAFARC